MGDRYMVKSAILPLALLIQTDDEEVLKHACRALFRLTHGKMDIKQAVIDAGVFPRLVELLLLSLIEELFLACLMTQNYKNNVKVNTCWIISFIIRRTKDNIQAVIEAGIISHLLQLLQNADFSMQIPLVLAIFYAITNGTNEQIKFLVHKGCIQSLCDLLVSPNEVRVIKLCLECLENILKVGEVEKNQGNTEVVNVFTQMIDDAGGLQKIKNVRAHDNNEIREIALKLLETYW